MRCSQFGNVRVVPCHGGVAVPSDRLDNRQRGVGLPAKRDEGVPQGVETDLHHGSFTGAHRLLLAALPLHCDHASAGPNRTDAAGGEMALNLPG